MTDIEIARSVKMVNIEEIASKLNIDNEKVEPYGKYKAKLDLSLLNENKKDGKLVLVTAISPTAAGEGKTTTTIGLTDALNKLGKKAIVTLREPSLGPVFGMKGGAAGGGYAQVVPMEDINLHFTGDFHAIGAANNLLAALIDNHIMQGNELNIDSKNITWNRVVDMNDRFLRSVIGGLGKKANGIMREDSFNITVASEVMAVFCLSNSLPDLKAKLGKMVVAYSYDNQAITCDDLKATGALTVLLKDAIKPNLVQTLEKNPAIIHGGPFANIAHGCNSVIATKMALKLSDYAITEAGFGADLGAEKFVNIKCRKSGLKPDAAVLVATIRALKMQGGVKKDAINEENVEALEKGLSNLYRHYNNITDVYKLPCVVAINRFPRDTDKELKFLFETLESKGISVSLSTVFSDGSDGALDLAEKVLAKCEGKNDFAFTYEDDKSIEEKINIIAKNIYKADKVEFTSQARIQLRKLASYSSYPICMAKTPYSFSDDNKKIGAAENFTITVSNLKLCNGAGFIVAITGDILLMPGLPKVPSATLMDIDDNGTIIGLS